MELIYLLIFIILTDFISSYKPNNTNKSNSVGEVIDNYFEARNTYKAPKNNRTSISENLFSTTKIANENGLTGPKLFSILINNDYVYKDSRKHLLTSKGKSIGGEYSYTDNGNKYIVWPKNIMDDLSIKKTLTVDYSDTGLTKKLLRQTKSKSLTIDILVKKYGISKYNAKTLVNEADQ